MGRFILDDNLAQNPSKKSFRYTKIILDTTFHYSIISVYMDDMENKQ